MELRLREAKQLVLGHPAGQEQLQVLGQCDSHTCAFSTRQCVVQNFSTKVFKRRGWGEVVAFVDGESLVNSKTFSPQHTRALW